MTVETDAPKAASLAAWKKAKTHLVTLHSGVQVEIQIPDLPRLIEAGDIPNDLVETAITSIKGDTPIDRDYIAQNAEFVDRLVVATVVNPKLTLEDARAIPTAFKELIAELATRRRDLDAIGHHIGGLHKSADFRSFRNIVSFDEDLESLL